MSDSEGPIHRCDVQVTMLERFWRGHCEIRQAEAAVQVMPFRERQLCACRGLPPLQFSYSLLLSSSPTPFGVLLSHHLMYVKNNRSTYFWEPLEHFVFNLGWIIYSSPTLPQFSPSSSFLVGLIIGFDHYICIIWLIHSHIASQKHIMTETC